MMAERVGNAISGGYEKNIVIPRLTLGQPDVSEETIRHHVRRYELAAEAVHAGTIAVDLCCGTGYGTFMLKDAGAASATGVDLSRKAIDAARKNYPSCTFEYNDVTNYLDSIAEGVRPGLITFFEAIEHVPREIGHKILTCVQGSLKEEEGIFFISTPRDIRSDRNPDHITQWGFSELEDALGQRFNTVNLFGQDWSTGEFVYDSPHEASFYVAQCGDPIAR